MDQKIRKIILEGSVGRARLALSMPIILEVTVTVLDCTPEVRHDNYSDSGVVTMRTRILDRVRNDGRTFALPGYRTGAHRWATRASGCFWGTSP